MKTAFCIEVKNITGSVDGMELAKGEKTRVSVKAETQYDAMQIAIKRLFVGCSGQSQGSMGYSDGTLFFDLHSGHALYGRVWCQAVELPFMEQVIDEPTPPVNRVG